METFKIQDKQLELEISVFILDSTIHKHCRIQDECGQSLYEYLFLTLTGGPHCHGNSDNKHLMWQQKYSMSEPRVFSQLYEVDIFWFYQVFIVSKSYKNRMKQSFHECRYCWGLFLVGVTLVLLHVKWTVSKIFPSNILQAGTHKGTKYMDSSHYRTYYD